MNQILPYQEQDLKRNDAIGGRAKREAAHYWAKRKRHCERWRDLSKEEVEEYRDRQDENGYRMFTRALQSATHWAGEVELCDERIEEISNLVRTAWE
jgi:hypothetical protein